MIGASAIVVALLVYFALSISGGRESGPRLYIGAVVGSVMELQKIDVGKQMDQPQISIDAKIASNWQESLRAIDGVSNVVVGNNGQLAVFSDRHDLVLFFERPTRNGQGKQLRCSTYPHIRFESLCSKLSQ